jgi:putative peptide zinc metalloprotease protein
MDWIMSQASSAPATSQPASNGQLPLLREDLTISVGPPDAGGQPTWQVYDTLRHRFIAIDHATCIIMSLWREHRSAAALCTAAASQLSQPLTTTDIDELSRFLDRCNLTQTAAEDWRKQFNAAKQQKHNAAMALVHNYLFFKIPLFSPERFLCSTMWIADFGARRTTQTGIGLLGLIGLILVSRQWDEFLLGARGLATALGIAQFAVTLFCVKILHELGHAYTAVRYGCRVPVIGIAFMMMAPVLYTDVTDAWRLADRRHRFAIDIAGVSVELALACLATFLWVFLPDGFMKQTAFMIATSSWIMSIGINLNPFMRFDGYYIFSDLLGIENLQSRSFDLGVWKMRDILLGLRAPPPERFYPLRQNFLIAYAWCVWLYRLVLFTGIALAVYAYFFKALGVILFIFEIGYFLVKPVWGEQTQWWTMRRLLYRSGRARTTAVGMAMLAFLFVVPWSSTVKIPAVLEAADITHIYPPRAAQVVALHTAVGQAVRKGDKLIQLGSDDLESERRITITKLEAVQVRLARRLADKDDRDDSLVLESAVSSLRMKLDGLNKEQQELDVRAPADGIIAEFNPNLRTGQWIGAKERIALLRGIGHLTVMGFVSEADLWRIEIGAQGRFIPDMPQTSSVATILKSIAVSGSAYIDPPELVSTNGGRIEAFPDAHQRLVPVQAQYLVTLAVPAADPVPTLRLRGVVNLQGTAESFFAATWRRALKVFVRESAA